MVFSPPLLQCIMKYSLSTVQTGCQLKAAGIRCTGADIRRRAGLTEWTEWAPCWSFPPEGWASSEQLCTTSLTHTATFWIGDVENSLHWTYFDTIHHWSFLNIHFKQSLQRDEPRLLYHCIPSPDGGACIAGCTIQRVAPAAPPPGDGCEPVTCHMSAVRPAVTGRGQDVSHVTGRAAADGPGPALCAPRRACNDVAPRGLLVEAVGRR